MEKWAANTQGRLYRRFIEAGIASPPEHPLAQAIEGWLLGSLEFVERIKRQVESPGYHDEVPTARRIAGVPLQKVLESTAAHYGVVARKRSPSLPANIVTPQALKSQTRA